MSIVTLKKVSFFGSIHDKKTVLAGLQALGGLHVIAQTQTASDHPDHVRVINEALRFLSDCPNRRHQLQHDADFDLLSFTDRVQALQGKIQDTRDQHDAVLKRIEEIAPWGNFILPDDKRLAGYKFWFYIIPNAKFRQWLKQPAASELIWQQAHHSSLNTYLVVLAKEEPPASALPAPRTHTGKRPLSQLRQTAEHLALQLEDLQAERESLTRWLGLMLQHYASALDRLDLDSAYQQTHDQKPFFFLQAWAPAPELAHYQHFAEQHQLALIIEDPAPDDHPPTLLSNPPTWSGGEDVVNFYQTPGYHDWDPSLVVFASFALFFAMILSDAGYALVFAALVALNWQRMGRSAQGQRLRTLAATLVSAAAVWGMLVGSYFGVSPAPDSLLEALKIVDLNDFDAMMRISIGVGAGHVLLANAIATYQHWPRLSALSHLGWALLAGSGFAFWLGYVQHAEHVMDIAKPGLYAAVFLIVLFSSNRPWHGFGALTGRLFDGIKNSLKISQLFGDVLSYMRLFALGLASASLAVTFNQLADQVQTSLPGSGLFLSWLILLLGHGLNLVLALMSGVVHGLRLNFIEFYNWSLSEEGYPFKAFQKRSFHHD
ncbi:MAG: ATPase [Methylococcales bacterium]|nr:ATPase [Methylococcales bacterium]